MPDAPKPPQTSGEANAAVQSKYAERSADYRKLSDAERVARTRELLRELPPFCEQYVVGIEGTTSTLTRMNYAYDLRVFFSFLLNETNDFPEHASLRDFTLSDLDKITPFRIEQYLSYTTYYTGVTGVSRDNDQPGKERKLSCLRSLYKYFLKRERVSTNPALIVDAPREHQKPIIRLEPNEVVRMLDLAESGEALTERQKKYHERTKLRDVALLTLLLGTGMRVSECVGVDMDDINYDDQSVRVTRKGGSVVILYFGSEVKKALLDYETERRKVKTDAANERALFLSMQKRRIDVRSVENLVKKYAGAAAPLKRISPHKLRSTFGTELYKETGDIYLVADVLGHADVNTTRRHYAAQTEENRRTAAEVIKLRDD